MLEFNKKLVVTGAEQKIRKDGTAYTLVHVMGENGATFACVYKGDINRIMSLTKMKEYDMNEVSVQGIIDLYFIDENDKVVLLDYKTDIIKDENILIDRYKIQLDIYQKALEIGLNRKIDEIYIYSICLNKLINL